MAFAALVLALRYVILPGVGQYQEQIEQMAGDALGLKVQIGHLEAHWEGINPGLTLRDVSLFDATGKPAFLLSQVDMALSWRTLWRWQPTLSLLALEGPVLHVRRDSAGRVTVAGIDAEGESDPRLAEWVLKQPHIRIRNAIIVWEDALRQAPPLVLEDLQFALDNRGSRHRFGLSAAPPEHLAARIDLRGDFRGAPEDALENLSGKTYLEMDYADLAGWRAWLDYPVELPRGRGALRAWAGWNEGVGELVVDLALEDVRLRLAKGLPQLDLTGMQGRLEGRYGRGRWLVAGRQVSLQTQDGIRLPPTDFSVDWRRLDETLNEKAQNSGAGGENSENAETPENPQLAGNASANFLDMDALKRLAAHLPLDAHSRALLAAHDPKGRISDLRASWEGNAEALRRYTVKARFEELGMRAAGYFPGGHGLTGEVDASEQGGTVSLESGHAGLDLPAIFPQPAIPFTSLKGRASWTVAGNTVDGKLDRLDFTGPHASGSATGRYQFTGEGPGVIDLSATITQADGAAVWRYMPHAVNLDARQWLQRGIVSGRASDAKLVLKGDLRDFPFRDKSKGEFLITAKAEGVKIAYAPGWPVIEDVDAVLRFGVGMRVEASKGRILGTAVGPVTVELPDFEAEEEMLLVKGKVEGPTGEFLRFIESSPVGDKINHFTKDMRATGHGRLDLALDMPLRHVVDTKVRGEYNFQNNEVTPLPGLPPVSQVNGRLYITEESISASDIAGQALGGPFKLAVKNEGERVLLVMNGNVNMREAKKHFNWPALDQLAGAFPWRGEVRLRKNDADFLLESNLQGLSSSLPEPFNKTAGSTLPLRIEKDRPAEKGKTPAARDRIRLALGTVAQAHVVRRQQGDMMVVERGIVAIGEAAPALPEAGVAVAVALPAVDLDVWRALLPAQEGGGPPPFAVLSLKTPLMKAFSRQYHQVEALARPRENGWQVALNTREAAGELFWKNQEGGWLEARLKRLVLPAAQPGDSSSDELLDALPGMEVHVDHFALGEKALGKLELKARNNQGVWHLDGIHLQNPDGVLHAKGEWERAGGHRTRLAFELAASDLGKFFDRLGYAGAVRAGTGNLQGDVTWNGPPTAVHYPSLTGKLTVSAAKGQFNKLEPGFGKLLGLVSLQSLPRRLTLDFRDIFSDGLAFDTIDGKLAVNAGIMQTIGDLRIDCPSATILMKGEADLKQETQQILVTVQPEMGMVVSGGAMLLMVHPAVGAAAALMNKLLQNPLNKLFSFQYRITGTWSEPKVEKVGQAISQEAAALAKPPAAPAPGASATPAPAAPVPPTPAPSMPTPAAPVPPAPASAAPPPAPAPEARQP